MYEPLQDSMYISTPTTDKPEAVCFKRDGRLAGSEGVATREHATLWGLFLPGYVLGSWDEGELVPKLVWRVKLVAELEPGLTTALDPGDGSAQIGDRRDQRRPGGVHVTMRAVSLQPVIAARMKAQCGQIRGQADPACLQVASGEGAGDRHGDPEQTARGFGQVGRDGGQRRVTCRADRRSSPGGLTVQSGGSNGLRAAA